MDKIMNQAYLRRNIFKVLKKSKLIFNTFEWITGYKDIQVQNRIHSQDSRKSPIIIRREKNLIQEYWHCGLFHYYRYGLPYLSLTDDELLDYVPTFYHHKKLEKDHDGLDTVFYGDKLIQARLFRDRQIPSAEVVAYNNGNKWFDFSSSHVIDIFSLVETSLTKETDKLFIKPTGGQGGFGIFVLKRRDNSYLVNSESVDLQVFLASLRKSSFILQKGLIQSNQMMDINPSSVNTLRVVVQKEEERMVMKTCIIRMGRRGKEVDNSAQGGVSVAVNTMTGQVAATATAEHGGGVMTSHPDTGKAFGDIIINHWTPLKREIEAIGTKLIDFKNIALDIAVTEEGAKLLEFNFRYGIEHQQCVLGGARRLLDIYPNGSKTILTKDRY